MKKNILIIILSVLVLGLGGYLVYDKVISNNNEVKDESKEVKYVGDAFSDSLTYAWPTEELAKDPGDPDTITKKVKLPKILAETHTTKTINDKIYNNYKSYIDLFDDISQISIFNKVSDTYINYDYKVYKNVLFIIIKGITNNYRASGSGFNDMYYYDIETDKELTVEEVCKRFNIVLNTTDTSAEKIYGVMPNYLEGFDVYYTQDSSCPSFGCMDMYSTLK